MCLKEGFNLSRCRAVRCGAGPVLSPHAPRRCSLGHAAYLRGGATAWISQHVTSAVSGSLRPNRERRRGSSAHTAHTAPLAGERHLKQRGGLNREKTGEGGIGGDNPVIPVSVLNPGLASGQRWLWLRAFLTQNKGAHGRRSARHLLASRRLNKGRRRRRRKGG